MVLASPTITLGGTGLATLGLGLAGGYVLSSFVFRLFAWAIIGALMLRSVRAVARYRGPAWLLLGVVSSFALDGLAVALGVSNLKFWC